MQTLANLISCENCMYNPLLALFVLYFVLVVLSVISVLNLFVYLSCILVHCAFMVGCSTGKSSTDRHALR